VSGNLITGAKVSEKVFARFPDYTAHLVLISGISNQPSNALSNDLLSQAEQSSRALLERDSIDGISQVLIWREAFRSFGVKPKDARSSFEALLRRIDKGLPRIDLLTDIYNALSIKNLIPIGGEDADTYTGSPQLVVANGGELFDTIVNGNPTNLPPEPEEIIWRDDVGTTCRRWNWRQCVRTRLGLETRNALFIFDGLGEDSVGATESTAGELIAICTEIWPEIKVAQRSLRRDALLN
jgi:DNA/RNA-binding domain of Phe-tRNA-synthetase-like protein